MPVPGDVVGVGLWVMAAPDLIEIFLKFSKTLWVVLKMIRKSVKILTRFLHQLGVQVCDFDVLST